LGLLFFLFSRVRGKPYDWRGRAIIPQYHPAVAVYDRDMFDVLVEDMRIVGSYDEKVGTDTINLT